MLINRNMDFWIFFYSFIEKDNFNLLFHVSNVR